MTYAYECSSDMMVFPIVLYDLSILNRKVVDNTTHYVVCIT